jgi:hypothetical protein
MLPRHLIIGSTLRYCPRFVARSGAGRYSFTRRNILCRINTRRNAMSNFRFYLDPSMPSRLPASSRTRSCKVAIYFINYSCELVVHPQSQGRNGGSRHHACLPCTIPSLIVVIDPRWALASEHWCGIETDRRWVGARIPDIIRFYELLPSGNFSFDSKSNRNIIKQFFDISKDN